VDTDKRYSERKEKAMSLWNPGTLTGVFYDNAHERLDMENVSREDLKNVLIKIADDHSYDGGPEKIEDAYDDFFDPSDYCNLNWYEMPIKDWITENRLGSDTDFDLLCAAADTEDYLFVMDGYLWKIYTAVGGMRIDNGRGDNPTVYSYGIEKIAKAIRADGFVNPDPYVGLIEVQYNSKGYCAGYGIRQSGKAVCWYN